MKTRTKYIAGCLSAVLMLAATGCDDKFSDYNTNPNESTKVTSSMLATQLILKTNLIATRGDYKTQNIPKGFMKDDMLGKYIIWSESNDIDLLYNKLDRTTFSDMSILTNVDKMVSFATDKKVNAYKGLGHILRAYKFFTLSMRVGDLPYSQAMQGESDVKYPVYDSQEAVMEGILNELDEANELLKDAGSFDGDPIYKGNSEQWRKAANVLELKVLINLYKKMDNTNLKVKERMQQIVSNRPLFESNDDNWQLVHSDKSGQKYPFYKEGNNYKNFPFVSSIVIDSLKAYKDRRLFYYAKPISNTTLDVDNWDAYKGVEPSMIHTDIQKEVQAGNASAINDRYINIPEGEPTYLLSYSEMNFILAEAAVRGIIQGDAQDYYQKGIRAAMKFTADNTPNDEAYNHKMPITDAYINEYLTQPEVSLTGSNEQKIEKIIVQKYLSTFLEAPYNAFFEYRRTGYPKFIINPKSNRNDPTSKMPLRWMYPQNEYDYNSDNVKAAVQSQFSGVDDNNQIMWILK